MRAKFLIRDASSMGGGQDSPKLAGHIVLQLAAIVKTFSLTCGFLSAFRPAALLRLFVDEAFSTP
jgi:hypothetical protein